MRFSGFSLASLPALALALCLLLASSPAEALSIPPSLKAPPRVKSVRATDGWTNAKRLAAGLPPRAPRTFKRATPTVPDPYAPVKRSAPSPSPSPFAFARPAVETAYEGRIVARYAGSDVPVGYVRASSSGVGAQFFWVGRSVVRKEALMARGTFSEPLLWDDDDATLR
ncbi:hypothetical protein ONZ51_g11336 [Trametes cubensis]|uniref:Uncharacterized protein n=1 Tax=Trametes cubensis TaxID=1111947 RepID=A0AAD7X7Y3_9APHY|nr:hypothetical protein ONZ51_g11336 [Trametes cubensis]